MKVTELKFKTRKEAIARAKEMKAKYGYRPSIFHMVKKKPMESYYVIAKPSGLKRI